MVFRRAWDWQSRFASRLRRNTPSNRESSVEELQRRVGTLQSEVERYRDVIKSLDAIAWEADAGTWQHTCVLGRDEALLGFPVERWLTTPLFMTCLVHPEDRERLLEMAESASESGTPCHIEYRVIAANGEIRWMRDIIHASQGDDGRIKLRGVMIDVTERKQAQAALVKSEQRQRFILDSLPQKIFTARSDGAIDYFNPIWCEYSGLSYQELRGAGWRRIIHPDELDENIRQWCRSVNDGVPFQFEHRFRRADGEYRWHLTRAIPMRDEAGRIGMWVGSVTDIHDVKQLQQVFREREAYFRELTHNLPLVVWTNSPDGTMDFVNNRWTHLTGQTLEDIEQNGRGWLELLHPDDQARAENAFVDGISSGEGFTLETRFRRQSDGNYRWHLVRCVPVIDTKGNTIKFLGSCTDIEEQKQLERQLREADRRKDEFLATLAHELRNPLAPIRTGLDLIKMTQSRDSGTIEEVRQMMERQLQQLVRLIDDLMDVSRITRGKLQLRRSIIDVREAVEIAVEAVAPYMEQSSHVLEVLLPPQKLFVDADPNRLAQVLSNLLHNAAKYSPRPSTVRLHVREQNGKAHFAVADEGVGIHQEQLEAIFDLFVQVSDMTEHGYSGLGIGRTLVKRLVELHGGSVGVASDGPDQGSEFTVSLPVVSFGSREAEAVTNPEVQGREVGGLRVLVVDDNRVAALALGQAMELLGNEVRVAYDGAEAVSAADAFRPEVVLMDIGMPNLNGCDAARVIRGTPWGREAVLVAVTGWGQEEDRRMTREAGFDYHVVKPAGRGDFEQVLAGAAERKTQEKHREETS